MINSSADPIVGIGVIFVAGFPNHFSVDYLHTPRVIRSGSLVEKPCICSGKYVYARLFKLSGYGSDSFNVKLRFSALAVKIGNPYAKGCR